MKEYLLLRNNKQSGPYSAGELQSMGLKSLDLIWVEKKSCSWRYPSEISELASFAPPMDEVTTNVSPKDSKVINMTEEFTNGRVTEWIKSEVSVCKSDTEYNVRHNNHIVALKPHVDHTRVKTIKSVSQPRIINVKVRDNNNAEKENSGWRQTTTVNSPESSNTSYLPPESRETGIASTSVLPVPDRSNSFFSIIKSLPGDTDNKLELMVLMIGAISLLAIAFLLITSPY
ncbi:MAG: hypothetical protein JST63_16260 [Bacteroidetes bacterium]|nr:hypothetical protein [Bacteroidota bacterium]